MLRIFNSIENMYVVQNAPKFLGNIKHEINNNNIYLFLIHVLAQTTNKYNKINKSRKKQQKSYTRISESKRKKNTQRTSQCHLLFLNYFNNSFSVFIR